MKQCNYCRLMTFSLLYGAPWPLKCDADDGKPSSGSAIAVYIWARNNPQKIDHPGHYPMKNCKCCNVDRNVSVAVAQEAFGNRNSASWSKRPLRLCPCLASHSAIPSRSSRPIWALPIHDAFLRSMLDVLAGHQMISNAADHDGDAFYDDDPGTVNHTDLDRWKSKALRSRKCSQWATVNEAAPAVAERSAVLLLELEPFDLVSKL